MPLDAVNSHDLSVCLVTVTYGDRRDMLERMLAACAASRAVGHIVVVDNGSIADLSPLQAIHGSRLKIVDLGRNLGSAAGYKAGIAAALATGADLVWLMDDDNEAQPDALEVLIARLTTLWSLHGVEKSAVLAYRPSIHLDILNGLKGEGRMKRRSSFQAFHVAQIPAKVMRLLAGKQSRPTAATNAPISLPTACYGGFLAHANAYRMIGLPFEDLVLYGDDDEYTARLVRYGGYIELIPDARVDDLDDYEQHRGRRSNAFIRALTDGSDFRIYYSFRTHSWISSHIEDKSDLVYSINRLVFMSLIWLYAAKSGTWSRFKAIHGAIQDGRRGRLGENPEYPLPQSSAVTLSSSIHAARHG